MVSRIPACRALTWSLNSSMIRRSRTSVITRALAGFRRARRLVVSGSLRQVWRFQTSMPTYSSLSRISVPLFQLPWIVEGPQKPASLLPPRGGVIPSAFSGAAIRRAESPQSWSAKDPLRHSGFLQVDVRFPGDDRAIGHEGAAHPLAPRDAAAGLARHDPALEATAGLVGQLLEELRGLEPTEADPHLVDLAF